MSSLFKCPLLELWAPFLPQFQDLAPSPPQLGYPERGRDPTPPQTARRPYWCLDYPRGWSLDEIVHQHFLACTWLSFWCVEEQGPANWPIRISFDQYCQSRQDHIREDRLRNHLFRVVLHMEQVLFWLSQMGFGVSWSKWYNQLLVRLFPEVYPDTPEANRKSSLAALRSRLLGFSLPEAGPRHGPTPFEAPPGIARIRLIPTREPDVRSGFQPSPDSSVHSASGAAVRFSTDGVLEYLDELASSDGQWTSPEETAFPGHIMVGDELDLEIIAAGLSPNDFLGTTLSMPPPPPLPTPSLSPPAAHPPFPPPITVLEAGEASPLPTPSPPPAPAGGKRARAQGPLKCLLGVYNSSTSLIKTQRAECELLD
ncbi:hypothetical protein DFH08DRAFT_815392 [Mycena albidolilacea]|uniref:Uncharacterized protein n=1 Tax=Mycena albidolilacea TaxID=1033008 RepID=A0AAD6ZNR3_9AGAR|nr:hypothetical protein DFH08DRAFT_815392 [Mycena albidolilacea]